MREVHAPVLISPPAMVQAWCYCAARAVTTDMLERMAQFIARRSGHVLSHDYHRAFPSALKRPLPEVAAERWKKHPGAWFGSAPGGPGVQLLAGTLPRRTEAGRTMYGQVAMFYTPGIAVFAEELPDLASVAQAVYARADLTAAVRPETRFVAPVAEGWWLQERLGAASYFQGDAAHRVIALRSRLEAVGATLETLDDGTAVLRTALPESRDAAAEILAAAWP